jgi:hypothetical protein
MMMGRRVLQLDEADPKGLVRESYLIEGITEAECKSIFIDWALSLKPGIDSAEALRVLIATYALERAEHPMSVILTAALLAPAKPMRRGGRMGRHADA